MATGGSSTQDDQRVVLLGKIGAGKSSLANRLLGHEIAKTEEIGLCMRKEGEHAGRKLTVVDTPGWDRTSVQRTPEKVQQEIIRSATLCLPGPHALLLVLPISMHDQPPSANEIKSASHHVERLSHRAWRHTIVVFVCKDEMNTSVIDQHVQRAKKLIDKCGGRYFIFHNDSYVTKLWQEIADMVEDNCGNFLTPKVSYEEKRMPSETAKQIVMYEKREEELKQQYRSKPEKMELDFRELWKLKKEINDYRRRSYKMYISGETMKRWSRSEFLPPNLAGTSQGRAAVQHQDSVKERVAENKTFEMRMPHGIAEQTEMYEKRVEDLKQLYKTESEKMELCFREQLRNLEQEINDYKSGGTMKRRRRSEFLPPNLAETSQGGAAVQQLAVNELFVIVMMAFLGALVGAILGATDGVQGSVVGVIFGSMIGVLLAILCFRLTRFVLGRGRVILVIERGDQNSVRSDSSYSSKSTEKPKNQ